MKKNVVYYKIFDNQYKIGNSKGPLFVTVPKQRPSGNSIKSILKVSLSSKHGLTRPLLNFIYEYFYELPIALNL